MVSVVENGQADAGLALAVDGASVLGVPFLVEGMCPEYRFEREPLRPMARWPAECRRFGGVLVVGCLGDVESGHGLSSVGVAIRGRF